MKSKIIYEDEEIRYFDKNGVEILPDDTIKWDDGKSEKVYLTEEGNLGTDATNPLWIKSGRAYECEYGIYPLSEADLMRIQKVVV